MLDDVLKLDTRERIIRREEISKINGVEQYAKHLAGQLLQKNKESERRHSIAFKQQVGNLKKESLERVIQSIDAFHGLQRKYLDSIEDHCKQIVSEAFTQLTGQVPDAQKLSVLVQRAAYRVSGEPSAMLVCHRSQEALLREMRLPKHWTVKFSESLEKNTCAIHVPLGEYRFSFQDDVQTLRQLLTT